MTCNICNSTKFIDWRGKPNEKCEGCGAKARHRVAMAVYQRHLFSIGRSNLRVLHLAPEACLHSILSEQLGAGYVCADASPDNYPHAECLKLYFPKDFAIFPTGYFDAILHNHVLEHIPGHYGDHLDAFTQLIKPGGRMIFSVPGPYLDRKTIEGGEHLASDEARLEKFLQEDHFKLLGSDFVEYITNMKGGRLAPDGIDNELRAAINVRPNKAPFFVWQKNQVISS